MLTDINPKLPMRNKVVTKDYYLNQLGFKEFDPRENYGQVYIRTNAIDAFYQSLLNNRTKIHPNGNLQTKPWGQKEFSLLDPDNNLLTFGQGSE